MPIDNDGLNTLPTFGFISETSLGWYRSGASQIAQTYGQYLFPPGTALRPASGFTSEASLGLYRSAASTLAVSYGTFDVPALSIQSFVQFNTAINPRADQLEQIYRGQVGLVVAARGTLQFLCDNNRNNAASDKVFYATSGATEGGSIATHLFYARTDGVFVAGNSVTASALRPNYAFDSDESLGLYRSAASTIALSYGTLDLTNGGAVLSIASLRVKSGTNNSCGTATLGSNGSVNVANTYVAANDLIFLTDQSPGGTLGDIELGGIRAGSGFTIQSTSLTDTSLVAWLIVRPT